MVKLAVGLTVPWPAGAIDPNPDDDPANWRLTVSPAEICCKNIFEMTTLWPEDAIVAAAWLPVISVLLFNVARMLIVKLEELVVTCAWY